MPTLIVGRFTGLVESFFELYHTLPQRSRQRRQSIAEKQQHNKQKYQQLDDALYRH
jgi:hypothetical protein